MPRIESQSLLLLFCVFLLEMLLMSCAAAVGYTERSFPVGNLSVCRFMEFCLDYKRKDI